MYHIVTFQHQGSFSKYAIDYGSNILFTSSDDDDPIMSHMITKDGFLHWKLSSASLSKFEIHVIGKIAPAYSIQQIIYGKLHSIARTVYRKDLTLSI